MKDPLGNISTLPPIIDPKFRSTSNCVTLVFFVKLIKWRNSYLEFWIKKSSDKEGILSHDKYYTSYFYLSISMQLKLLVGC